jgi:hypothetical protein
MAIRINYRNIPIWLADQLRRPKWFKNLFVTGNAWAAFSKHSHVRASDGQPKVFYPTKEKALKAAEKMSSKHGVHFSAYKCLFCDGWHVGRNKENKTIAIMETEDVKHAGGIDVERMMRSSIPDLLPIYGGFRGRTLSSPRLQYAWKTIVESGVSQVIDLRADYKSDHYKEVCKAHGIDYFHYPVEKKQKGIEQLSDLFPKFCEIIDRGGFYIACAQGLHRTDTALCLYWVFHGADKGLEAPALNGFLEEKGRDTRKVMGVLNAFYKYQTEQNKKPPIPMETFKKRKDVIYKLSKA